METCLRGGLEDRNSNFCLISARRNLRGLSLPLTFCLIPRALATFLACRKVRVSGITVSRSRVSVDEFEVGCWVWARVLVRLAVLGLTVPLTDWG